MKNVFEKYTFWIMMILFVITCFISYLQTYQTSNLNRSIGWGWDLTNYLYWMSLSLILSPGIFTIGYGILYLRKRKSNFLLSILHIFLVLCCIIIPDSNVNLIVIFYTLSWIIFISNILMSKQ